MLIEHRPDPARSSALPWERTRRESSFISLSLGAHQGAASLIRTPSRPLLTLSFFQECRAKPHQILHPGCGTSLGRAAAGQDALAGAPASPCLAARDPLPGAGCPCGLSGSCPCLQLPSSLLGWRQGLGKRLHSPCAGTATVPALSSPLASAPRAAGDGAGTWGRQLKVWCAHCALAARRGLTAMACSLSC